jgi:hypothetical protein
MLPSSGQISMSELRDEFGYSGTVDMYTFYTNRYTCRGGGYSLSDWYSYRHYPCLSLSNSATLYYFYQYDGGNIFGQRLGWGNSGDACAHLNLSSGYSSDTVYYNGTLGNGTYLYLSSDGLPITNMGLYSGSPSDTTYYYISDVDSTFISSTYGDGTSYAPANPTMVVSSLSSCTVTYSLTLVGELSSTLSGQYLWYKVGAGSWTQDTTGTLYAAPQTLSTIYGISYGETVMLVISDSSGPAIGGSWIPTNIATGGMPSVTTGCTILGLTIYADTTGYAIGYTGYGASSC